MQASEQGVSVFWFRRDLRLHDNHGLYQALKAAFPVLPVFIFDKNILDQLPCDDRRVTFIHKTISNINDELKKHGSSLLVVHGKPLAAFEKICDQFHVKAVFTNNDYEPYARERDEQVKIFLRKKDIAFHSYKDQVMFEKDDVMKPDGSPYTVFTPYSRKWKEALMKDEVVSFPSEKHPKNFYQTKQFHLPSLKEIGFEKTASHFPEKEIDVAKVEDCANTRNIPGIDGTSRLGLHLRFGTVSIRHAVRLALQHSEVLLNELIWREFFMMILYHYPRVVHESFKKKYDNLRWRNNEAEFDRWCKGETGYPFVDAGMRELNETGFMHNRVRMVVASFLTKHLLIDWRWGEAYFAEKLLDYELASNNGNWQWAAGSGCDAAPYFRIFNPVEQQKKFDPEGKYFRKWVPEFPDNYTEPIVDHVFARQRAIDVYKAALR
ncbi:MAG: cryptochrome/photolyase family protein [Flavisolibacter sp.]